MRKRTVPLGVLFGLIIAVGVVLVFQQEARPFSPAQLLLLLLTSILPGLGLALLLDPYSKRRKEEYLGIDFYAEEDRCK